MTNEDLLKTDYEQLPEKVYGKGEVCFYAFKRMLRKKLECGQNVYIYAQCYKDSEDYIVAYEVIKPRIVECIEISSDKNGKKIVKGKGIYKESYPTSEDWGSLAHTFTVYDNALKYFNGIK